MKKHEVNIQQLVGAKFQSILAASSDCDGNSKHLISVTEILDKDVSDFSFKVVVDNICVITTPTLQTAINVYNKH